MIIHFTQKLRKKIDLPEVTTGTVAAGAHLRWYANLFKIGQTQFILTTNAASLYSVVIFGRGIADSSDYLLRFLPALRDQLESNDMEMIYLRCIAPHTGAITLAKTESRSVLGSMNDMVNACEFFIDREFPDPWRMGEGINNTPYKAIGHRLPRKAFAQLPLE